MDMACPCFEPRDKLPWSAWPGRYRPPLGRPYAGVCRSQPDTEFEPDRETLVSACNRGYARDTCNRVPPDAPDAVRYSLAESDAVRWAIEREHMPVDCGTARPGKASGGGSVVDCQIEAFRKACRPDSEQGARRAGGPLFKAD